MNATFPIFEPATNHTAQVLQAATLGDETKHLRVKIDDLTLDLHFFPDGQLGWLSDDQDGTLTEWHELEEGMHQ